MLRMRVISAILNFLWCYLIALWKLSNDCSDKFSWILTQTEVISFRNLYMIVKSKVQTDKNYSQTTMKLRSNTHGCELTIYLI